MSLRCRYREALCFVEARVKVGVIHRVGVVAEYIYRIANYLKLCHNYKKWQILEVWQCKSLGRISRQMEDW